VSAILAAALEYAEHGWPVVALWGPQRPVTSPGKQPWAAWADGGSTDFATIRSWWERRPDSNVGVVTGPVAGLAVLDVDPRHDGVETLTALEQRAGVLPGTLTSLTGGGGLHLLYAHPGQKVTSAAGALGEGLDVKADGGMIVVPPSVHPSGQPYRWHGAADVWKSGLAIWPSTQLAPRTLAPTPRDVEVRHFLAPVVHDDGQGHVERRIAALVQVVMDARQGERNNRLHWTACRFGEMIAEGRLSQADAVEALRLVGEAVGLEPAEVRVTVRSGLLKTTRAVA